MVYEIYRDEVLKDQRVSQIHYHWKTFWVSGKFVLTWSTLDALSISQVSRNVIHVMSLKISWENSWSQFKSKLWR
jgi:hypothetical protein